MPESRHRRRHRLGGRSGRDVQSVYDDWADRGDATDAGGSPRAVPSGMADTPDIIVLVHGFWVTPRSWEHWIDHYQGKGFRVLAPAYPGYEVEVEALNADPTPIEEVTVPAIIGHLEAVVADLVA
jgi:hypothetical protein